MKKKIILLVAFGFCAFSQVQAQTSDAEADAVVNLLGIQKREAVSKLVPVTGKDSINFWKLYDEYQITNKVAAKTRINLYERTAKAYSAMDNATAESLAKEFFNLRMDQEKNLQIYHEKIKKAINAVVAFEFYQAEAYIQTQIRASLMQQIPTYGQVEAASKNKK